MTINTWDKNVLQPLTKSFENEINKLDNQEFISFCLKNKNIRNVLEDYLTKHTNHIKHSDKNNELSIKKRIEGNEKFNNGKYNESLSLYTDSIFYAKNDSESLSLGYSNRSLALQKLGHFIESLQDIDLALNSGCSSKQVKKLILRKAKCLIQLGDYNKAKEILKKNCNLSQAEELFVTFKNEAKFAQVPNGVVNNNNLQLPVPVGGLSNVFPSASSYINVFYDETLGRHVKAVQDIEVGDILFVEKPFAYILFHEVCHNCCRQTIAPIPCNKCLDISYCSIECKKKFEKSVHSFECGKGKFFKSIGIAHLSLRLILAASSNYNELKKLISNFTETKFFDGIVPCENNSYHSVYGLITNLEKYEVKDLFQYALTASLLALYLKNQTSYFVNNSDKNNLDIVASTLFKHILQLICNGHAITEILTDNSNDFTAVDLIEKRIGTAIYPSASMMNHSCEPSIINSFYNNHLIVRASKPIKKGEEIFNCYGPHARRMKKVERQEILSKQYFFNCHCVACDEQYDIMERFTAYLCLNCKGPMIKKEDDSNNGFCLDCNRNSIISEDIMRKKNLIYIQLEEGKTLEKQGKIVDALKKFLNFWKIGRKILYKFHKDLSYAADQAALCLAKLEDFYKCLLILKCTVLSVEKRFGSFSIELANELKKIGDVSTNYCIKINQCNNLSKKVALEGIEYYKRAKEIIQILIGNQNNDFKEIENNIDILKSL